MIPLEPGAATDHDVELGREIEIGPSRPYFLDLHDVLDFHPIPSLATSAHQGFVKPEHICLTQFTPDVCDGVNDQDGDAGTFCLLGYREKVIERPPLDPDERLAALFEDHRSDVIRAALCVVHGDLPRHVEVLLDTDGNKRRRVCLS